MRLLLVALGALVLVWPAAAERLVTDSAGREVAVPDRIGRVFAAGPPASILLYVLAPDRMIGWPRAPRPNELPYIAPEYRDLPEVGWLTGRGDTVNLEVLLQSEPDLTLDFGNQALVLREIRALAAQGYGIVLSTHDPDHAFACASAVALLHGGGLVATGSPSEVLSPARLEAVYGLPVAVEHLAAGHTVCVPDLSVP